jgi:hypothetical protein
MGGVRSGAHPPVVAAHGPVDVVHRAGLAAGGRVSAAGIARGRVRLHGEFSWLESNREQRYVRPAGRRRVRLSARHSLRP